MAYNPPLSGPDQPQDSGGAGTPPLAWQSQAKGFFGVLFDFGFNHFATFSVIKALYVLGFIDIALSYLAFIIFGWLYGGSLAIIYLLIGLIVSVVCLAFLRVTLEFFFSVARMSEDIRRRGFPGER